MQKKECNRYKLLTKECLEIHELVYHGNHQFEDGHRPIEHSCKKGNEKLKYKTLIETNIFGESKYRDEKGNENPNIKIFQNRTSLAESEIRQCQKKRKENTLSSKEEERRNKLKITCKNYQTNKEKEKKKEKCKNKNIKRAKRKEEVLEAELLLDITYIFNE